MAARYDNLRMRARAKRDRLLVKRFRIGAMDEQNTRRGMTFVLSVWKELSSDVVTVCHGSLKATTGQEWMFETLAELDYLLCEIGGWIDPLADKGAETKEIP